MGRVRWTVELERALLQEIQENWTQQNHERFRNAMTSPAFALHDGRKHLGQWMPQVRTITMSRHWVQSTEWSSVIEVLKHEMAHQYVSEILKIEDEKPHGPAFRSVCTRFHVDARAAGTPKPNPEGNSKVVEKIQKLLALAQSPNEHEAKIALQKARQWMNEHELEWSGRMRSPTFIHRCLGQVKGRFDPWEKMLAGLLAQHFFVHAIWIPVYDVYRMRRVRTLEVCGRPQAIEVAEYTHEYLTRTAQKLWLDYKNKNDIRSNRERRTFLLGVMMGFSQSLDHDLSQCKERGLIPAEDHDLQYWFVQRHQRVRRRRGPGIRASAALNAGQSEGRKIEIKPALTRRHGLLRKLLN